tara:strand:- start:272 stop:424 length:153 start_codon:yes stop_codon:yes gene_type:complete
MALQTIEIEKEIEAIRKATREIRKDKKAALEYLIKHGFLTPEGKLADQYK